MDLPVLNTANARKHMVDSQIRPNKVNDETLLDALRTLKRELFVPAALADFAYIDEDVPLGNGRYLMEPMILARLLEAASVQHGEKVLVVASGTGYGAALLSMIGAHVTALEDDAALRAIAARVLPSEIKQVAGKAEYGAQAFAPYDAIVIEAGVPEIPDGLAAQLAPEGRIVAVIVPAEGAGTAVRADLRGNDLVVTKLFDCQTPVLPALLPKPGFSFD
jgi:protein-L-isoaspartate(D-aspartate) O-methyltransferase